VNSEEGLELVVDLREVCASAAHRWAYTKAFLCL